MPHPLTAERRNKLTALPFGRFSGCMKCSAPKKRDKMGNMGLRLGVEFRLKAPPHGDYLCERVTRTIAVIVHLEKHNKRVIKHSLVIKFFMQNLYLLSYFKADQVFK